MQIQAVDPYKKSEPQFKEYCSFCHKKNHAVSTCYLKINMLKESKRQSKSPTSSFYQHFKTPSNKNDNQTPRYRSSSNSNHYRRFSRESRYISRSHSRSNSLPRYYHNHSSLNHSHIMIVIDLDIINITKTPPHAHFILLAPISIQPHLVVHLNVFLVLVFVSRYKSPYRAPSKQRSDRYRS